ncbi:hypothetical protein SAMN05216480_106152 [Pustulibacterium marinum]|uniref:Lipoprotein n=1 Tax=Pustulibacterium marinum TaxID=1224947 RepID=A0A1I7H0C7_9FLAO|nr:hypothetical protein [Pustulibacterium marinum]SFU54125.1 hypothetical protein SAMN05216480_106152 [Pustulibacterium marinum]
MRKTLSILILILILSCEKSDYKTIDYEAFEITVPKNWSEYEINGIDSYVSGLITDKNDTLIFDLGWYSPDLTKNPEVLVFEQSEYAEFSDKQKKQLKNVKHLVIEDFLTAEYDAKDYLKYEFQTDSIDCFVAKFIKPKNKGFGASGIYIDSLIGGGPNSNKTRLSFYGNNLSDSTQVEFFSALKTIKLTKYCE